MVTASIVTFHTNPEDLKRIVNCISNSCISRLYIIDNSSNDDLKRYVNQDKATIYIHTENLGYGSGHNIAIRKAIAEGSDYHVILNPDVYWQGNVVDKLVEFMEMTPDCGMVMPKVLYPSGDTQYLCKLVPSPKDLILRRFIPIKSWQAKNDYEYEMHWTGYDKILEIPILSGCFMILRCEVLKKTGFFDERFFLYAEDVDLCRRIGAVSRTIFYPEVSIYHEYAKGSYKNRKMLMMHIKSIVKYFNKWGWFYDSGRRDRNRDCIKKAQSKL